MAHGGSRYNWGLFSLLPLNPTYGHIPIFIIKFTLYKRLFLGRSRAKPGKKMHNLCFTGRGTLALVYKQLQVLLKPNLITKFVLTLQMLIYML